MSWLKTLPLSSMRACGAVGSTDQATPAPQNAEIGRAPATPQQVDQPLHELKEGPPKKFDVARIERIEFCVDKAADQNIHLAHAAPPGANLDGAAAGVEVVGGHGGLHRGRVARLRPRI